jgi:Fe-S-cluster containining protein
LFLGLRRGVNNGEVMTEFDHTRNDAGREHALAFYRDLHRAMDATLDKHAPKPQLIDALLAQAFDSFQGNVEIQCEGEPPLACARGCASCCMLRVSATAPEVFGVARFMRMVEPELLARGIDLMGALRQTNAKTQGLDEAGRIAARTHCPFVAQGVCVIYSVRPLACRGHASHDMRACVEAMRGDRESAPYSHAHYMVRAVVQNAMQSALRDARLAWHSYEFIEALLLALDTPDAERAWLAGADALAPAALRDVSEAEMAEVFDRLRPRL